LGEKVLLAFLSQEAEGIRETMSTMIEQVVNKKNKFCFRIFLRLMRRPRE